ncbi:integral membrane protein 2A-like [Achroia grisella]|uniref:integral membrane protein 2A-like n=1 Tax=Achroia grisella TaxID=688607 RepID=UPI0027D2B7EA|nr:integral membrane protein 2A-like [Achroia grisella]
MTILTKPSIILKKSDVTESPLVHDTTICDEDKVEVHMPPVYWSQKKRSNGLLCMSMIALLMAVTGIISGLLLYRQYLRTNIVHRYQGFCSIPREPKPDAQLRWHSDPDPDVQVFSTTETDNDVDDLLERLEIDDDFERIIVIDSGRNVEFIHNFNINMTGIVDKDRCFFMPLETSLVLPPPQLLAGVGAAGGWDVSRVRSALLAALPPAPPAGLLRTMRTACRPRTSYMLRPADLLVRKRSVDEPQHDYIQFAGQHIQEIQISNMAELLEYERNHA